MYKVLTATGYSSGVEELVEVLSCMLLHIHPRPHLKESSVFNFQPQLCPCPEPILTVLGPNSVRVWDRFCQHGPSVLCAWLPTFGVTSDSPSRKECIRRREGLLAVNSPRSLSPCLCFLSFSISAYDMGFSLCIYPTFLFSRVYIFFLICYHAYISVKSATAFEIIWLWSSSVYCCLVCL